MCKKKKKLFLYFDKTISDETEWRGLVVTKKVKADMVGPSLEKQPKEGIQGTWMITQCVSSTGRQQQ